MGTKLSVKDVISYSAYETRNGYVKRSDAKDGECTADIVVEEILNKSLSDEDLKEVALRVKEWSDYINEQSGEYFDNVKSEVSKPLVDETKVGLIASSFASFDKYKYFKKLNENDAKSEYLGEEGDLVEFNIDDYKLIKTGSSKFGDRLNKWYLYKIHSGNNVISYFSNNNLEYEFKHSKRAKATISKLSEYNNIKQTGVTKMVFLDD